MATLLARFGLGISVSVFAVSAAMAADIAEPQSMASGTAGVTIGGTLFLLPTFNAPPVAGAGSGALLTDTFDILAPGATIGVGASFNAGQFGDLIGGFNLNGFGSFATGSASATHTLTGDGVLYIPGITTPAGSIALLTDAATPSASSNITGTTSDQLVSVPVNAGGAQNAWGAEQGTPGEFTLAGGGTLNDVADMAVAFGAIANGTGGAFLASGDLTGVVVTTATAVDIIYTGGDLTYGLSGAIGPNSVGQIYAGPSFRYLDQKFTTDITVDMAEVQPVAPADFEFPIYRQTTNDDLAATYVGGVIGASVSTQIDDAWSLSLNGEGGLYWANANLSTTESYNLSGGGNAPVTDQTVDNATTFTDSASRLAYAGRVQAVLSTAISENQQIHFGGNAEYLSAVPTVSRVAAAYPITTPGAGDATYVGASTGGTTGIAWGDMISVGATVSLTGQF